MRTILASAAAFALFTVLHACSSDTPASDDAGVGNGDGGANEASGGCDIKVAATGDDAACAAGKTCKTVTKALSVATSGCTVRLAAGTYADGETFPLEVADGVRLVGAGSDTTIDASGAAAALTKTFAVSCPGASDAQKRAVVAMSGKSTLLSVTVVGPSGAADLADVLVTGGEAEIGGVGARGGADGIFVAGAGTKANVHDVAVTDVARSGIKPGATSTVTVTNATVTGTRNAFEPICGSTTTFTKCEAFCNGNGVFVQGQAKVTFTDGDLHANRIGVAAKGAETSLRLESTKVHDNEYGIVSAQAPLEAGNKGTPGNNTVAPNLKAGIYLEKVATDVIAFGNTWVASVDGADATGHYVGDVKLAPPSISGDMSLCPKAPYGSLDADPPASCTGDEKVTPAAGYQNVVLVDHTCPPAGPAVTVGTLALSTN